MEEKSDLDKILGLDNDDSDESPHFGKNMGNKKRNVITDSIIDLMDQLDNKKEEPKNGGLAKVREESEEE